MSISYEEFSKVDLRVAKILSVEKIPGKTRIVKGIIDLGETKQEAIIGGAEFLTILLYLRFFLVKIIIFIKKYFQNRFERNLNFIHNKFIFQNLKKNGG